MTVDSVVGMLMQLRVCMNILHDVQAARVVTIIDVDL